MFYDAPVVSEVLNHARRDAQLICVSPTTGQDFINRQIRNHAKRGLKVVCLKSGDAMVSGRVA